MKKKLVIALALAFGVTGCRDPGGDAEGDLGRQDQVAQASGAAENRSTEPGIEKGLERPLPGGIEQPSFSFHLSLDQDVGRPRDGRQPREIGLEFLGPTPAEAEAEFSSLVVKQGGSVKQRRETEAGALRLVYVLPDSTEMLAWFRSGPPPGLLYALQRDDASGTLYLAWPYVDKSAQ